MPRKIIKEEKFLDKFTEEMILNAKKEKSKPKEKKQVSKKSVGIKEEIKPQPIAQKMIIVNPPIRILQPMPLKSQTPPQVQKITMQQVPLKPIQAIKKPIPAPKPINISEKVEIKQEELPITNIPLPPRPIAPAPGQIDFGKINFLVQDPLVTQIEAPGDKKNVIIKKTGNVIRTQIVLTKEEILFIIKSFSEAARIPLVEGMLIARIGNIEMTAVVSAAQDANVSFVLRKEPIPVMMRQPTQLMRPLMQITPAQPPKPVAFVPPKNPIPQAPVQPQNLPNKK